MTRRSFLFLLLLLVPLLIVQAYFFLPTTAADPQVQPVMHYSEALPGEKIYLHVDRPFYKPGDDIWFKAYLLNGASHQPSSISEILYVQLINPKGNVEKELRLVARDGNVKGDFHLSSAMAGGIYKIKAYTQWMKNQGTESFFKKDIQVQAVVYPKILLKLDFEREAYGAGDEVSAKLEVHSLTKTPIALHPLRFSVRLQDQELMNNEVKTNRKGIAYLNFSLPDSLLSSDALLNVQVEHDGNRESISRSVPVILNNIDVQFFPEGGDMVAGVDGRVAFKALNEWGKAADVEGYIKDERNKRVADFSSFHFGMGAFSLKPEKGKSYQAVITKPAGIARVFTLPEVKEKMFALRVETEKEQIQLKFHAPQGAAAKVQLQSRGEILYTQKLRPEKGGSQLTIPTGDFPAGVVQLTLFDAQNRPQCERLVFLNQHKSLSIEITTDKEKYLPREKVNMHIRVKDEQGKPVAANLSLAVVDEKLLSFADDRQDNILSYLLLSSEVKGKIEKPAFYFDPQEPKAARALDYLLMTQGWRRFSWEELLSGMENGNGRFLHAPEKAVLKGRIVNYKDEAPLGDVKVSVLETGEHTHTDEEGKFEFTNLNLCTTHTLKAEINGREQLMQVNRYAQEYIMSDRISGKITNPKGKAIPGATVLFKGTNKGTSTDAEGRFEVNMAKGVESLMISYSGYKSKEVPIKGKSRIFIELEEEANLPDEATSSGIRPTQDWEFEEEFIDIPVTEQPAPPPPPRQEAPEIIEVPDEEEIEMVMDLDMDIRVQEDAVMEDIMFEPPPADQTNNQVYEVVTEQPTPEGGMEAFYKFVHKKIRYPRQAAKFGVEGRVFVQFVVNENGDVENVRTVKGIGAGCDEAAEQVIRKTKWYPGRQRGRRVAVRMIMPIVFKQGNYEGNEDDLEFLLAHQEEYNHGGQEAFYYCGREFYSPAYQADEQPKERTDFRKTIYWNPEVKVGASGEARLSFHTSDEISSFKAVAEGIGQSGSIGRGSHTLFSQLPFFLEGKIPPVLTYEDKLSIPVLLKNNTDQAISGMLHINPTKHIRLLDNNQYPINLKAGEGRTVYIKGEVEQRPGIGELKVSFRGQGFEDAFVQPLEVVPKGFPMAVSYAGKSLNSNFTLSLDKVVENSLSAGLTAYPNMLSELMKGVESILREPYGCFEQASSATYPNILALQYLNETSEDNFEVKQKALNYIQNGYHRLTSFETEERGYEWFGAVPPHEELTAYGLMEFTDMQEVYASVDSKMMDRTTSWLLSRRDGKGGFSKGNPKYSFGRASQEVSGAYITYALSEAKQTDLNPEWQSVYQEVLASKDAYRLGLVANTACNLQKYDEAAKLLRHISRLLSKHGYKNLPAEHSFTYSQGISLQVETAALIVMAYLKMPEKHLPQIQEGIDFLLASRSGYGGFGSTQSTIMALKALTAYAKFSKRTAENGIIEVYVNGQKAGEQAYEKDHKGDISINGLEAFIKEGSSDISVQFKDTKEAIPFSLGINWTGYTPLSDPDCKVSLSTTLRQKRISLGETSRMDIQLENKTAEALPMTVALIGIPSGMSVQPWQLKELGEKKVFDFYEINKNYLVLYYRNMAPEAVKEISLDLKSELPGTYEAAASSAYLYYTNENKDWKAGERIEIKE